MLNNYYSLTEVSIFQSKPEIFYLHVTCVPESMRIHTTRRQDHAHNASINIVNFNNVKNSSHMSTIDHALAAHEVLINLPLINLFFIG